MEPNLEKDASLLLPLHGLLMANALQFVILPMRFLQLATCSLQPLPEYAIAEAGATSNPTSLNH